MMIRVLLTLIAMFALGMGANAAEDSPKSYEKWLQEMRESFQTPVEFVDFSVSALHLDIGLVSEASKQRCTATRIKGNDARVQKCLSDHQTLGVGRIHLFSHTVAHYFAKLYGDPKEREKKADMELIRERIAYFRELLDERYGPVEPNTQ